MYKVIITSNSSLGREHNTENYDAMDAGCRITRQELLDRIADEVRWHNEHR